MPIKLQWSKINYLIFTFTKERLERRRQQRLAEIVRYGDKRSRDDMARESLTERLMKSKSSLQMLKEVRMMRLKKKQQDLDFPDSNDIMNTSSHSVQILSSTGKTPRYVLWFYLLY